MVERYKKWMSPTKFVMVALLAGAITPSKMFAQGACPSLSNSKCRAEASGGGQLLHKPNGNGDPVWTAACGHNVSKPRLDPICQRIATCKAAGAYGGFLYAVTESCGSKHFDDYFGLDGLTFGIAHWTQNNLPKVLHVYQARSKDQYEKIFGPLNIPINNGCVSAQWVCEANKQGRLACAPDIRDAFFEAMKDPEFVKAEIDVYRRVRGTSQTILPPRIEVGVRKCRNDRSCEQFAGRLKVRPLLLEGIVLRCEE